MSNSKNEFLELFNSKIKREGKEELLAFLERSDFFTTPASTRFHNCHEGGLCEHSINVCKCLLAKKTAPMWALALADISDESLAIIGLLHDVCKTYYYTTELKNKKIYSEHGSKYDSNGRYDWETVPSYTVDNKMPLGHGEKSIFIINKYMQLTNEEMYAIRWHMGFTEERSQWGDLGLSIRKYPIVLATFQSDLEATYLLEEEC